MTRWKLYLLGSPRLERDGETVPIRRRKTMALLAYLAVTRRTHQREALATLLWSEWDASSARADLRRTLSLVNRALGGSAVVAGREAAGLDPDLGLWVDVVAFRQALTACADHAHSISEACGACVPGLEEAVSLYQDDFLAGFTLEASAAFDEWQFFETQALRDAAAGALARLVTWHAAQGERSTERAIAYARRWLALDPLHEPAHQQLMALYFRAGQRSAALRQYRLCLSILEEELGATPSEATKELYEQVRSKAPPVHAAVISPAARSQALPPPAFLDPTAPEPTAERPVFVAREAAIARLQDYLEAASAGRGQVAFVIGGAGRGKTALLREFAQQAMQAHPQLLAVSGACNAAAGIGDPFLPFREALGMLTGDLERQWRSGTIAPEHARRLWSILPTTLPAVVTHGPHVIDTLVPGAALIARARQAALDQEGWFGELQGLASRVGSGGLAQQALFQQVTNLLRALSEAHPLLLTLDDLQWSDQESVGLLFHLGRRLAGSRILLLGAYRPEEVAASAPTDGSAAEEISLVKVLAELKRDFGDVWIDLREADAAGGRQFVDAFLDSEPNRLGESFRQMLLARTGGHALFTVELLRTLQARGDLVRDADGAWREGTALDWGALPARVEAVIAGRLDRLGAEERELLTVAAVEGETFTAQVAAQVLDWSDRAVLTTLSRELAGRHRLVREAGELQVAQRFLSRYAFAHALFREHLYQELSAGERRLLHEEVGTALEQLHGADRDRIVVQLAYHFDRAGNVPKAITYHVQAGEQARLAYANDEASAHFHRALALLEQPGMAKADKHLQLEALSGLGKLCFNTGKIAEAEGHLSAAVALGKELGLDPQAMALLYHWLGEALWWQSKYEERLRIGEEGLALLGDDTRSLGAALMNQVVAVSCGLLGDWARAGMLTLRTANFILELPLVEELLPAYDHIRLMYSHMKDAEEARKWQSRLETQVKEHCDLQALGVLHKEVASLAEELGDITGAIRHRYLMLETVRRTGNTGSERQALGMLSWLHLWSGDLAGAEAYNDQSRALQDITGFRRDVALGYSRQGHIALCRSDWAGATTAFQEAERLGEEAGVPIDAPRSRHDTGRAYLASGDAKRARQSFAKVLEDVTGLTGHPYVYWLLVPALSGLEEAYADPAAFRDWCRAFREAHLHVDALLGQWAPAPAQPRRVDLRQAWIAEPEPRSPDWIWDDPFGDCNTQVKAGLVIYAANGRTLWGLNLSAPRLMQRLPEGETEVVVQVTCEPALSDRPGIGGLLLWMDRRSYLWLELGRYGRRDVAFGGCLENRDLIIGRGCLPNVPALSAGPDDTVFLRLELSGDRVDALCSLDGEAWYSVGRAPFAITDAVQVGVHAIGEIDRSIYHGAYPEGTAIRFASFKLWA